MFDSINHDVLLSKYEFYGLRGKTNALLRSYLRDSCQRVLINNSFSMNSIFKKKTWCSSGFNTWSLFFLNFINDLPNIIRAEPSKPISFADDKGVIIKNLCPSKFKEHVNNISDSINDWHIFLGNSAYRSNIFKIQKRIIKLIMNARNRDSCRQLFKNRIQKFIILTPDLVLTLHTPNTNLTTFQKSRGKS